MARAMEGAIWLWMGNMEHGKVSLSVCGEAIVTAGVCFPSWDGIGGYGMDEGAT